MNAYTGQLATRLEMKWRFAIRTSDAEEYMFSFSGEASSSDNASSVDEHMIQMTESAIGGLLEKWGEADILAKLKAWSERSVDEVNKAEGDAGEGDTSEKTTD